MTGKASPTDTTPAKGTSTKAATGKASAPSGDDGDPYAGTAPAKTKQPDKAE